jgi:hypothetical protein
MKKKTIKKTVPKKRAKAQTKTDKLSSLTQVHGKKEQDPIERAKELEELVGIKEVNPFGTSIAQVFEENIQTMSMVELQELAVKAGVFPTGNRTVLKSKLSRAFSEYNRSSMVIPAPRPIGLNHLDSEATQKAIKLMKEGL